MLSTFALWAGAAAALLGNPTLRVAAPAPRAAIQCSETNPQDKFIAALRAAPPQQLNELLANNMKAIDQRLFLRLAEMSDEEKDPAEKQRIGDFATLVTNSLERIIARADAQLNADSLAVQTLMKTCASASGEFDLPVPAERIGDLRALMREQVGLLDEGFVGTVKAYMKKADNDGLDGLVEVLRLVLQTFAAEKLITLLPQSSEDPGITQLLTQTLEAPPSEWEAVLRTALTSEEPPCSADQLQQALQDKMGEIVLGLPSGSTVQTVLAEFLNELIQRCRTVAGELI